MSDTNQATEKQKIWNYSFPADGVKITLGALGGSALLIGGLSQIFNPIALGLAAGYAVTKTVSTMIHIAIPALANDRANKRLKNGLISPVPDDAPIVKIAADISEKLGRDTPPKIYFADKRLVAKMALPFGFRWMMKIDAIAETFMPKVFSALPGTNTLFTTREGLAQLSDKQELAFVTAHEMCHLKKDHLSPAAMARSFIKSTSRALFWGSIAALGAGVFGITLPVSTILGGSVLAAIGGLVIVKTAAQMVNNYALRTAETRADRNAIYITRDVAGACAALENLLDQKYDSAKPVSAFREALSTHPTQIKRTLSLHEAFKVASEYPKLGGANDNAAPLAERTEKKKIAL